MPVSQRSSHDRVKSAASKDTPVLAYNATGRVAVGSRFRLHQPRTGLLRRKASSASGYYWNGPVNTPIIYVNANDIHRSRDYHFNINGDDPTIGTSNLH
jgi:hypothetical protein